MIFVANKSLVIGDWFNGIRIIEAGSLVEAIKGYLAYQTVVPAQDENSADAFGIEISDAVRKAALSCEDPVGQAEALAGVDGVKFFEKV